ncbi:Growth hormone receptor [Merluccius polli]|uniref:Growth hormone receptor n=1 Tax=Merluccius polli TaxID=89951 RepID=A0AA47M4I5_MERPO|nr:Growth hormone receptor [Merluccius polli]
MAALLTLLLALLRLWTLSAQELASEQGLRLEVLRVSCYCGAEKRLLGKQAVCVPMLSKYCSTRRTKYVGESTVVFSKLLTEPVFLESVVPPAKYDLLALGSGFRRSQFADLSGIRPQLTGCVSNDMETFRCSWSVGTFLNLSQPGDLRLFYINANQEKKKRSAQECPQYGPAGTNECFFNENHTSIWTTYSVQLCSRDRAVRYDEAFFHIEEIVQPDPPVGLNWTLLTVGLSGTHFDIKLSWEAPQTADVRTGWMTLQYEVQHRQGASAPWNAKALQRNTDTSLYGLQTNIDYEVRVRSKMLSSKEFGAFSDSIVIHVPSKVSRFPVAILLIFAALCFIGILMLVMQQKLMIILLPPVPGPKINGIDPELLKKGKLSELMSILGEQNNLKMNNNNNQNDPWEEFIDLDMEEEPSEPSCGAGGDGSLSSCRTPLPSPGLRDDSDSGRDSCCCCDAPSDHHHSSSCEPIFRQQPGPPGQDTSVWVPQEPSCPPVGPGDLYTQVSHVHCSGEVLLAAGEVEQPEEEEEVAEAAVEEGEKQKQEEKKKENAKIDFQLLVTMADAGGGYSSERDAGKRSVGEPSVAPSPSPFGEYQGCYPAGYTAAPPQSYTLVEGVDKQNSLLLRPNTTPAAQLFTPKAVPTPEGYLTPDLLRDITP